MLCFFCFCYLKYHIIFYRIFRSIYLAERQLHMKKLSQVLLADTISRLRKEQSMTQQELAEKTGINRSLISRIEKKDFMPSIPQLEALGEALGFEPYAMFTEKPAGTAAISSVSPLRIAVAGTRLRGTFNCNTLSTAQPCYCC